MRSQENPRQQANRSAMRGSPAAVLGLRLLAGVGFAMAVSFSLAAQMHPEQPQQIVVIKQMHFQPANLNVKVGQTVEWKNEDIFSHTVTANDGSFESGLIAPGRSWQTTINKPGLVAYHCGPHPNMRAQLVVEQPVEGQHTDRAAYGQAEGQTSLRWSPPLRPDEIHPILVNFTAALLPLALLSDLLGRIFRRPAMHVAGFWMMAYEAGISPLTVIAGWWWKNSQANQLPAKLITVHQWLGTGAALLFILLAVWRWTFHKRAIPPSWVYLAVTFGAFLALVYQGSLGGAMVFGK